MVWLAGYQRVDLGKTGGGYDRTDNPKLCWHTTEGGSLAGAESAFAPYPPHLGVDPDTGECHQYLDLARCAYSLGNSDAEDSYVIQVEVVGYAAQSHTWSPDRLAWLGAHVAQPVADAVGVPPTICPQGFHGEGEGMILASSTSPIRFTLAGWDAFAGHVGHQHCPGDDHWDPGRLDLATILSGTAPPQPEPEAQEITMRVVLHHSSGRVYITDGITKRYITDAAAELPELLDLCGQDAAVDLSDYTVDRMPEILSVGAPDSVQVDLENIDRGAQ
ncbi:MAG TPA: hypothetical protein VGH66_06150 [Acidimicrobiales bacterium]|jgi:hypothetical protein